MKSKDWRSNRTDFGSSDLLEALLRGRVVADQVFENGEYVTPVFHHAFKNGTELRLALCLAVPLGENGGWDADIAAQFIGGMAAEKQAVEKCGFALRELEVLQSFVERAGDSGHGRKRSLQISAMASRPSAT
jgi:hypothetical protein